MGDVIAVIWARLQGWLVATGVALAVVAGAFLYGRSTGKADAKADQANANAKAVKRARGVEDEINGIGDGDVDARLSKWMRDGGR